MTFHLVYMTQHPYGITLLYIHAYPHFLRPGNKAEVMSPD